MGSHILVSLGNVCSRADSHGMITNVDACVSVIVAAHVQAHEHARELGGRPETLCVAGDSAGGNLSGVTAMMARDKGTPAVAFQLMVSPVRALCL